VRGNKETKGALKREKLFKGYCKEREPKR